MKVVTSGYRYLDIDAYAGCVAYAELLNLLGEEAIAASSAPLNESITPTVRDWKVDLARDFMPKPDDEFVLVDLSDPEFFDTFVGQDKVVEILDHHMEFAEFWQQKIGSAAQIEFIGAACTLVYERWQQAGKLTQISETSARLLITGILDNTLNFEARVTTERDKAAYAALSPLANLSEDWPAKYFEECQSTITGDLPAAIRNDVKVIEFPSLHRQIATGQLVVWNGKDIAANQLDQIKRAMTTIGNEWFMNIVSIAEGHNYLIASDAGIQRFLEQLVSVHFTDSIAATDRLWLRKEIMKQDMEANQ